TPSPPFVPTAAARLSVTAWRRMIPCIAVCTAPSMKGSRAFGTGPEPPDSPRPLSSGGGGPGGRGRSLHGLRPLTPNPSPPEYRGRGEKEIHGGMAMRFMIGLAAALAVAFLAAARADDKDKTSADEKAIRQCSEHWIKAFNSGNV